MINAGGNIGYFADFNFKPSLNALELPLWRCMLDAAGAEVPGMRVPAGMVTLMGQMIDPATLTIVAADPETGEPPAGAVPAFQFFATVTPRQLGMTSLDEPVMPAVRVAVESAVVSGGFAAAAQ